MNENKDLKNKKAVALTYKEGFSAPKVTAKGKGYLAEKILDTAKDLDIPIYKDESLVDELEKIDLGANIPPYIYDTVAQVLIFISDLDKRASFIKNAK